jgi:hypothetical protein
VPRHRSTAVHVSSRLILAGDATAPDLHANQQSARMSHQCCEALVLDPVNASGSTRAWGPPATKAADADHQEAIPTCRPS